MYASKIRTVHMPIICSNVLLLLFGTKTFKFLILFFFACKHVRFAKLRSVRSCATIHRRSGTRRNLGPSKTKVRRQSINQIVFIIKKLTK